MEGWKRSVVGENHKGRRFGKGRKIRGNRHVTVIPPNLQQ